MKLTALLGKKRTLLIAVTFVFSPALLASCGGGGTTIEEVTPGGTATEEAAVEGGEVVPEDEELTSEPAPAPSPTSPSLTEEVKCGIGAFNVLSCTNTAGTAFSCSGDSSAVGGRYGCTDPAGDSYGCEVVASRMGGFTLSCTKLLQ